MSTDFKSGPANAKRLGVRQPRGIRAGMAMLAGSTAIPRGQPSGALERFNQPDVTATRQSAGFSAKGVNWWPETR